MNSIELWAIYGRYLINRELVLSRTAKLVWSCECASVESMLVPVI